MKKILFIIIVLFGLLYSELVKFEDVKKIVIKECQQYPSKLINTQVVRAIMYYESKIPGNKDEIFDTMAESHKGCRGLMQISDVARIDFNRVRKIYDPDFVDIEPNDLWDVEINIRIGIFILAMFLDDANGNIYKALSRYSNYTKDYSINVMAKTIEYYSKLN